MSDRFDLWVHGVSVIPEYRVYKGDDLRLDIYRAGWGARVTQKNNTWNWFHFAIPSGSILDGDRSFLEGVMIRCKINDLVTITSLHVHHTGSNCESPEIWPAKGGVVREELAIRGAGTKEVSFKTGRHRCEGPIVICVRVEFSEGGEIIFTGAGAHFEARKYKGQAMG
jgi:hypothetical protein